MPNIKLSGVLRYVSLLIIFLLIFLYIILNTTAYYVVPEIDNTNSRKKYEYRESPAGASIPEFTFNLESLFPRKIISEVVVATIIPEPAIPVDIPSLQFVGMIETDERRIYSFRNLDTTKLLLFEEGVTLKGIKLIFTEDGKYTFMKNETTFQVGK